MNRAEPTPEWTPPTTEERAATIVQNYRDYGGRSPAAIEADDHIIGTFTARLRRSVAGLDAATVGEVCVHLGAELETVMCAMEEQGVAPERLGPFLANLAGLAGVRLYRAAELGADWVTL